jgi:hypothetical protein
VQAVDSGLAATAAASSRRATAAAGLSLSPGSVPWWLRACSSAVMLHRRQGNQQERCHQETETL